MLEHFIIKFTHYYLLKTKENFTLLTLKVVANAYEMWLAEFQISARPRVKRKPTMSVT